MSQIQSTKGDLTNNNIITGVVLVIFSMIAIFWLIPGFVDEPSDYRLSGLSPRFFPYLSAIVLGIWSAIMILENMVKRKKNADVSVVEESEENETLAFGKKEIINCILFLLGSIVYMVMLKFSGFIISSSVILGFMMFLARVRILVLIPVSILVPVVISQVLWLTLEFPLP